MASHRAGAADSPDEPPAQEEPGEPAAPTAGRRRWWTGRSRRFWIGVGCLTAGGLIVLGAAWIAVTGLMARSALQAAKADVATLRTQLTSDDTAGARRTLADLRSDADRASFLTSGPAWATAAALPGPNPLATVRGLADAVDSLAGSAAPGLVEARADLSPATLRTKGDVIDVAAIARVAPAVQTADDTVAQVTRSVAGLPSGTGIGAVDDARRELLDQLDTIAAPLHTAAVSVRVAPALLGADGPRRYFVAFVNDAELRGAGGLPGGFAIVLADHGRITFTSFHSDGDLDGVTSGLDLGADYSALWGGYRPTSTYTTSNVSANFPYAARIWAAMWQRHSGQHIDGAVSLDPTALGDLLGASGASATLPDGSTVAAGDVAAFLEQKLYEKFPTAADNPQRKTYLVAVARSAASTVIAADGSLRPLIGAARRAVDERRLLLWTSDASVEDVLAPTPISGEIPRTAAPFVAPVIVNDSGGKLDYYLDRSATWTASGCGASRTSTVDVRLTNSAPTGLPAYVTDRTDAGAATAPAGSEHVRLVYYATSGARLLSATLDGATVRLQQGVERGHPVIVVPVELPRASTRTIRLTLTEPDDGAAPVALRQPTSRPLQLTLNSPRCGS